MVRQERLGASVLSSLLIPNVDRGLAASLELKPHHRSLGIVTSDCDDVTYVALDEATKAVNVEIVYARSMYAGAGNASTKLAGEVIGIVAGPNPEEVRSALDVIVYEIENGASFYSANDDNSIPYFAHCISRAGSYLSQAANATEGTAIAYLIAPPAEAMVGLDAALKAADVQVGAFYGPPSETNFAGGLLVGSQSACRAACDAFARTVEQIADNPRTY
ncbi:MULTISPECIES: ethanolamine utilization microcompartment protein EutL [unclassified Streptococcus]|uniref:ethanolamine utilization microcompartment protein EutL n=1 Tax=unclassified Streptococcus TaxID=2608887 RepID=UPI0018A96B4C|nr:MULTISPECIES: ethanolamine utilization microcompartment protein EutL [unclassified Streptococcus]MBF8969699.1 ethanolamine utilization microcompartment protein EutL [Streptococcus sp. NLN76]MBG9366618.1 ethanolamine utilization microcompartment protein EutL [Streptococcus sp. NLN64]MBJ6744890.1 ethanolamine utilization microcompartment protein EutL [Streptococcus sp. 121]